MEQIQNNRVITDLYRENAQFPGIALDGSDVYLCWQRFVDRHDSLMASCRRGDEVVWEREISDGGEVLHPVILAHGGAIWYAWSEYARENWRILARCYRDGQWGEVLTVASGEALFFPACSPGRAGRTSSGRSGTRATRPPCCAPDRGRPRRGRDRVRGGRGLPGRRGRGRRRQPLCGLRRL
ncbi:MAG: hypothetical protein ACLRNQ_15690 [Flavonifractor plautii]